MLELCHDEDAAEVGVGVSRPSALARGGGLDAVRRLVRAGILAVFN